MFAGKKRKLLFFAFLILGSTLLLILVVVLHTKYFWPQSQGDNIENNLSSGEKINTENLPALSDFFNFTVLEDNNNQTLNTDSQRQDDVLIRPKNKTDNLASKDSCEIDGQSVPEGVVIFDTTCTTSEADDK